MLMLGKHLLLLNGFLALLRVVNQSLLNFLAKPRHLMRLIYLTERLKLFLVKLINSYLITKQQFFILETWGVLTHSLTTYLLKSL